jgi:N-acetylglucosaminyldiphosphoundecaprenol N-acetyl-beta-D-mannosaminyltransferase
MGVNVAAIDAGFLSRYLDENLGCLRGQYVCVCNVHTTVMSWRDREYQAVQNGAALVIPDGKPLSVVGRRRGHRGMDRVTGPDLMTTTFSDPRFRDRSHYFYGSSQATLDHMRSTLETNYPALRIAGMFSPPFRQLSDEDRVADIERIRGSEADFVWVGLGAPKQERWMADHLGQFDAVMIGVGAGFDYLAGNIRRAPRWMQNAGLEWAYRLMQDPARLFGRYASTNWSFLYHAVVRGR